MEKPLIRIVHNLARSGGTLLGRCIGCMSGVVLLSEIHPLGTQLFNPLQQAYHWHHLVRQEDISGRQSIDFIEAIRLIERKCSLQAKYLVIRDWAHLDFIGRPFLRDPSNRLLLSEALASDFELCRIALVRHPIDQWLSSRTLAVFQQVTLGQYLQGYLAYTREVKKVGFIRYEDFTQEPEKQMRILCQKLRISFDGEFLEKWGNYCNITGDTGKASRGGMMHEIVKLPRKTAEEGLLQQFRANNDYQLILELLGYRDE